jgi:hypothetical protein
MSRPITPQNVIEWRGEKWIEVEWPSDGRYDIGYQLAHPVAKPGSATYMGLFESVERHTAAIESLDK